MGIPCCWNHLEAIGGNTKLENGWKLALMTVWKRKIYGSMVTIHGKWMEICIYGFWNDCLKEENHLPVTHVHNHTYKLYPLVVFSIITYPTIVPGPMCPQYILLTHHRNTGDAQPVQRLNDVFAHAFVGLLPLNVSGDRFSNVSCKNCFWIILYRVSSRKKDLRNGRDLQICRNSLFSPLRSF